MLLAWLQSRVAFSCASPGYAGVSRAAATAASHIYDEAVCVEPDGTILTVEVGGYVVEGITNIVRKQVDGASCVFKVDRGDGGDAAILREAKVMKELGRHHAFVRCFGTVVWLGDVHLRLEYAPRGTLFDLFAEAPLGPIPASQFVCPMLQVTEALCYAHAKGVAHCDLKEEQFLVFAGTLPGGDAIVKLGDFGASKILKHGEKVLLSCWTLGIGPMVPENALVDAMANDVFCYGEILRGVVTFTLAGFDHDELCDCRVDRALVGIDQKKIEAVEADEYDAGDPTHVPYIVSTQATAEEADAHLRARAALAAEDVAKASDPLAKALGDLAVAMMAAREDDRPSILDVASRLRRAVQVEFARQARENAELKAELAKSRKPKSSKKALKEKN